MSKFAMDCRNKMHEVMHNLEATLGPDTLLLSLRVGLHSGPTTAGVLRGAKSRFQLFGDTVNTSARMESNGVPNKIHASQATADLLVAAGKGLWLIKRDDLIEAKGKGKMQTWWIHPTSTGSESVAPFCDMGSLSATRHSLQSNSVSEEEEDINDENRLRGDEDKMMDVQALKTSDRMLAMQEPDSISVLSGTKSADAVVPEDFPGTTTSTGNVPPIGDDGMVIQTIVEIK
jgi:Adenylate and Guanylate cyclase catalytic domain